MKPRPIVSTCFRAVLLAVLALATQPAAAMNDPVIGRWLTRDPLAYSPSLVGLANGGGYHDGMNLSEFTSSNPVKNADPSGTIIIGLDGKEVLGFDSGRDEIEKLGQEILVKINAWRQSPGVGLGPEPLGFEFLRGGDGVDTQRVKDELRAYHNRMKHFDEESCGVRSFKPEGFVIFGYSDGATTIHRTFRKCWATSALSNTEISYVGLIDMVRWHFWMYPNTSRDMILESPVMNGAHLVRNGDVFSSQSGSFLLWRGYKDVKLSQGGFKWTAYYQRGHMDILLELHLRQRLVNNAFEAYKAHVIKQRQEHPK